MHDEFKVVYTNYDTKNACNNYNNEHKDSISTHLKILDHHDYVCIAASKLGGPEKVPVSYRIIEAPSSLNIQHPDVDSHSQHHMSHVDQVLVVGQAQQELDYRKQNVNNVADPVVWRHRVQDCSSREDHIHKVEEDVPPLCFFKTLFPEFLCLVFFFDL